MSDEKTKKVDVKPDKTVFKSLALGGLLGGGGEVLRRCQGWQGGQNPAVPIRLEI